MLSKLFNKEQQALTTAYITHSDCELHEMETGHPESPQRLAVIRQHLIDRGLYDKLLLVEADKVDKQHLYRVHRRDYVDGVFGQCQNPNLTDEATEVLGEDVIANQHTLNAALRAAGAVVQGVDMVMKGKARNVFCAVRPPGHHAERSKAMGFCVFSNIAVGVAYALEKYRLDRVAVVDFDVHHGNGTEDALRGDARVLFCSSYQHPFYPFSVPDSSHSNIIHTPMHAGTSSDEFRDWVQAQWMPRLDHFKPQMMFVSAGFDAHQADPLADIHLDERDFKWITRELRLIADKYCPGKIVSSLEGGYNLTALSRSAYQHISALWEP